MTDDTRGGNGRRGLADAAVALVAREASRVPMFALSATLQAWERTRGLRAQAMRQGAFALQLAAHTPLGRFLPQPDLDDGAQDEAARILQHARETTTRTAEPTPKPAAKPASTTDKATKPVAKATKTAAKTTKSAARKATPPKAAVEVGAPGAVTEKVEKVAQQLEVPEPESRDDLPIPDFDNVSLGSLRARLRSLSAEELVILREWEQAHAHRLPVLTLLDNRIAKVAADAGSGTSTRSGSAAGNGSGNGQQRPDDTASANPAAAAETPYPAETSSDSQSTTRG